MLPVAESLKTKPKFCSLRNLAYNATPESLDCAVSYQGAERPNAFTMLGSLLSSLHVVGVQRVM